MGGRPGGHDFGSCSLLARELVGWSALASYDEVLLVNDPCWLLRPLDSVFARLSRGLRLLGDAAHRPPLRALPARAAGGPARRGAALLAPATAYRYPELVHVGSYFLALRRPVLDDPGFRRRLDAVRPQRDRANLVQKYETGTTQYLLGQGFAFDTFVPDLRANHPVYGPGVFDLVADGFPLFKRRFLVANPYDTPDLADWKARLLAAVPTADWTPSSGTCSGSPTRSTSSGPSRCGHRRGGVVTDERTVSTACRPSVRP